MVKPVISPSTCDRLQARYRDGASIRMLADEFGCSPSTARTHAADDCVHPEYIDAETCARLRERYADGAQVADLAAGLNKSRYTIRDHVHEHCGHGDAGRSDTVPADECPVCYDDVANLGHHLRSTCEAIDRSSGGESA